MVMPKYEECRMKRLEENKKRMEALNLPQLARALAKSPLSVKPSPMKQSKGRTTTSRPEMVSVRRSSRVANNPAPVYVEVSVDRLAAFRRIIKGTTRDLSNRVYASDEARAWALEKAEEVQSGLDPGYPSFVKSMLQSHISGGFWLGLPSQFCRQSLSRSDQVMTLVDEEGDEYETVYLARKSGLSGGWMGFAVAHQLADGDAVVFELIRPTKFKVHIIRAKEFDKETMVLRDAKCE